MPTDATQPSGGSNEAAERLLLAERLKTAREYLGFSQDEVAQYLGVSRSALSNIETAQRRVEAVELKRLAQLYKKPVGHFTGDEPAASSLPDEVEHLAKKASDMSKQDLDELSAFADFLRSRGRNKGR